MRQTEGCRGAKQDGRQRGLEGCSWFCQASPVGSLLVGSWVGFPGRAKNRAGSPAARLRDGCCQVPGGSCPSPPLFPGFQEGPKQGCADPAALSALPVVPGQAPHMAGWDLWECPAIWSWGLAGRKAPKPHKTVGRCSQGQGRREEPHGEAGAIWGQTDSGGGHTWALALLSLKAFY